MTIVPRILAALWAGLALSGAARATDPGIDWCRVPEALVRADSVLPRVAEAIAKGQPIKIVILGTASSAGAGVSAPYQSYPERLREELDRRLSGSPVTLVNLSRRGWTAVEMAAALDAEVIAREPTLVVWQTGSVEAVRGLDVNQMGDALGAGIRKLRDEHIDVILIEPQYNPHTISMINFEPYADYMQQIARSLDVNLFNRHDIMKHWVEEKFINFDLSNRASQRLGADQVHGCLAVLLADLIERAARLGTDAGGVRSPR
jgi:hypothetical protein